MNDLQHDPILSRPKSRARARIAAWALAGAAGLSPLTVQGDQSIANQAGAAFRSDLNNELQALVTFSRGATAPGTTYAGQQWDDSTANVSKKRNAANSGWIVKDTLDESFVLSRGSNTILGLSDIWKTILATAGFTQTFTAAATLGDGWGVWFVNTHASAACTLDPNASETINGATTLSVPAGAGGFITCNGSAFRMVLVPGFDGVTISGMTALNTNAASDLSLKTNGNEQVRVVNSASATRYLTITGSNGGNPLIGASAGSVEFSADTSFNTGATTIMALKSSGTLICNIVTTNVALTFNMQTQVMVVQQGGAEKARFTTQGYIKGSDSGTYDSSSSLTHELDSSGASVAALVKNSNAAPLGLKILQSTDSNGTGNQFLQCIGNATTRAELRSNGGLANFSANNVNLSDMRVKPVFEKYSDAMLDELEDKFIAIERGRFKYADQEHTDWNYGKSAQSVQAVLPELVDAWNPTRTVRTQDDEGNDVDTVEETPLEEQLLAVHDHDIGEIGEAIVARLVRRVRALEGRKV